jgi:hypothetical protein
MVNEPVNFVPLSCFSNAANFAFFGASSAQLHPAPIISANIAANAFIRPSSALRAEAQAQSLPLGRNVSDR